MFQINYKECKLKYNNVLSSYLSSFRLTIRNVNVKSTSAPLALVLSFRLTIRNVNVTEEIESSYKDEVLD